MTIVVPFASEVVLERVDVLVAGCPEVGSTVLGGQLLTLEPFRVDSQGNDFFVVRSIEDADPAAFRCRLRDPPQIRVVQFLR